MSIVLALCAAVCSSFSTVITKRGVKNVESSLATLIRISITSLFTLLIIMISGSGGDLSAVPMECLLPLLLSGACSGFSWLFYFKALSLGDVSKLTPVDHFSTVLTMLLAILFLHETVTAGKLFAMLLIFFGTLLMVGIPRRAAEKASKAPSSLKWLPFSLLALTGAACSPILVRLALKQMDSTLVTVIRNLISLLIAAAAVLCRKQYRSVRQITPKNWHFLIASGLLIGISALCSYQALQLGEASIIVPIEKSSLLFTVLLSYFVLKERPSRRNWLGLLLIVLGTLPLIIDV